MIRLAGVLLLENQGDVLVIQRAQELRFQPGYWSFPGGGVEAGDAGETAMERAAQAAGRECGEEVGITLPEESLACLRYLGRWQTPPYAGRGYDTFFFALRIDGDRPKVRGNAEVADWQWLPAATFRQQWQQAEKIAALPVLRALDALENSHGPPFHSEQQPRGFLSMGGPAPYLPLKTATLPPGTHTNCVSLPTAEGFYLVDPAPVERDEREILLTCLAAQREHHGPLLGLILTHLHYDHLGAAGWLAEQLGTRILASRMTADDLSTGAGGGLSAGGASGGEPLIVDDFLQEGDRLGHWEVLETPGHARGHLCFFEPRSRVLVCGDMCAGEGTILIEPSQGDMGHYLASLQRLADLEPRLAIPAHGQPLAEAGRALRALRGHRLQREQKVLRALRSRGPADAEALTPLAYADADPMVWPLARLSVESHLRKLANDGCARQTGDAWVAVDDGSITL